MTRIGDAVEAAKDKTQEVGVSLMRKVEVAAVERQSRSGQDADRSEAQGAGRKGKRDAQSQGRRGRREEEPTARRNAR